jgi:hypothetical protein
MYKFLLGVALTLIALDAASQAPLERVRGTVKALENDTLVIATPTGGDVRLALTDTTGINGLEARKVGDIGENTFIGTTATKGSDGRWKASEVHIFPESMRGAGEGHYAWDLPESTMTNAAVTGTAAQGRRGRTLSLRYADGAVEVDVTRKTKIVALTMGSRALLVPGAAVFALAAPQEGGGATAVALIAETNGVEPPM